MLNRREAIGAAIASGLTGAARGAESEKRGVDVWRVVAEYMDASDRRCEFVSLFSEEREAVKHEEFLRRDAEYQRNAVRAIRKNSFEIPEFLKTKLVVSYVEKGVAYF